MTKARENSDGGLVLIGTSNPSAASSVSFTNLSVGKRYRVIGNMTTASSSTSGTFIFKFREGSTDKSTGYYGGQWYTNHTGGSGIAQSYNNAASTYLGSIYTGAINSFVFDVLVVSASWGTVHGLVWDDANVRQISTSFKNNGMSNFNGFSVYSDTGTFNGLIKLYEYR